MGTLMQSFILHEHLLRAGEGEAGPAPELLIEILRFAALGGRDWYQFVGSQYI